MAASAAGERCKVLICQTLQRARGLRADQWRRAFTREPLQRRGGLRNATASREQLSSSQLRRLQLAHTVALRKLGESRFGAFEINPDSGVTTSSGTVKSAGLLQLDFSRPIWLGRFGLAPGLGVRAFSAKRALTIEGEPELQLSTPSVHAFLSLLIRVSE